MRQCQNGEDVQLFNVKVCDALFALPVLCTNAICITCNYEREYPESVLSAFLYLA